MRGEPSVILIGLDGGTFDLIDPWVSAGELPAIGSLLTGARGELASTHPPLTPVAWPSLMTGCDPGQHGSWGFLKLDADYRPQFLNGGSVPLPTVFELLSTQGLRAGTLNLPWTWPPREVNGWWLSGLDAPALDSRIAHPSGLFEEIQRRFDGYFDKTVPPTADDYALDRLEDKIAKTGAIARYLARANPVDLMAVAFVSTDHVQHWFWQSRSITARDGRRVDDILLHTYRLIDREIARIIEECASPETTVMLVSDHGAGPTEGGIDIAGWLSQQGWLHTREPGALGRLRRSAFRLGGRLLPGTIKERLRGRLAGRRRAMLARLLRDGIDWERTRAFCWSDYGNLSLNLQDRFSSGSVHSHDTEALVTEIAEALGELCHPETGERVMSAPLRPREVYAGPRLDNAPDLLAVPRDYRWEILSDFTPYGPIADRGKEGIFGPALRQATHRLHGIIAMHGRGLRDDFRLSGARIEDVTPTVLHLLGREVPSYMHGRVLTEALEVRGEQAPTRCEMEPGDAGVSSGYTDSEAAAVERDLHGLGYV